MRWPFGGRIFDLGDKVSIDLDVIDVRPGQDLQTAKARPEVVDRELETMLPQSEDQLVEPIDPVVIVALRQFETYSRQRDASTLEMFVEPLENGLVIHTDQSGVEVDEQGALGKTRHGGERGESTRRHHMLQSEKLIVLVRPVEKFDRRGEAQAVESAHEALIAETIARRSLHDRLKSRLKH